MNKFKKSDVFVPIGTTKYIYQGAKIKKNRKVGEVTIGIVNIAIPIKALALGRLTESMFENMEKVAAGFPDVSIKFNFNENAEAYLLTITAKTECREDDTFSAEAGKKIVDSKIQAIALRIAKRMANEFRKYYAEHVRRLDSLSEFLDAQIVKEKNFVGKALYLPKKKGE